MAVTPANARHYSAEGSIGKRSEEKLLRKRYSRTENKQIICRETFVRPSDVSWRDKQILPWRDTSAMASLQSFWSSIRAAVVCAVILALSLQGVAQAAVAPSQHVGYGAASNSPGASRIVGKQCVADGDISSPAPDRHPCGPRCCAFCMPGAREPAIDPVAILATAAAYPAPSREAARSLIFIDEGGANRPPGVANLQFSRGPPRFA